MFTILVTAATAGELSRMIRETGAYGIAAKGVPEVYEWRTFRNRVIVAVTGMGKVNAALSSAALICALSPDLIINTGCAGAYGDSGLAVGDIALASSEIYGDEGLWTASGWHPLDRIGIPLAEVRGNRYFNEIPLSMPVAEKAYRFAEGRGIILHKGKFVTVSTCSGTSVRGAELSRRFGAICENMEGAAVAHAALRFGLDCMEIRGISNMVEDRDLSRWDLAGAVDNVQRFIMPFVESL
ncbi:MAG: purine or other phosphorylase, family 1 [Geobacteraceae bacterium]|nr:purine or other phosphorylase, family 1 [Geobacteraceae bacterium]